MMYSGDEDYDDDVTSGLGHQPEPDDFDERNRKQAAQGFVQALGEIAQGGNVDGAYIDGLVERDRDRAIDEFNRDTPKRARKPRTHPERDLEKACSDLLAYDGWRMLKTDPVSDRRRGKGFGEIGMADCLYIRYGTSEGPEPDWKVNSVRTLASVLWIEWKSPSGKPSAAQRAWIAQEKARGALVLLAGEAFPATVDGFLGWYRTSGLMRRPL